MRILVTGGAGYVGGVVADRLLRDGHDVFVLDNLSRGHRQSVPAAAQFILADTGDEVTLDRVFREGAFDAVMHFAAFIDVRESTLSPEMYFDNNYSKTDTVLRMLVKHGVSRFVFSSTAAVYGEPESLPITEDHPLAPTNPYGESKRRVEEKLAWFYQTHGLRYATLRYFNAAGALTDRGEAHQPETHLIPLVCQAALDQRASISIYGTDYPTNDGTCIRDYVHVSDLADAHVLALGALADHSEIVCNLGSGAGFSVREIIEVTRRITGMNIRTVEGPRRRGEAAVLVASAEKAKRVLGWNPAHSDIEAIVRSAWEWHKRSPTCKR
jgi:UDP-glucose 4-epimerase